MAWQINTDRSTAWPQGPCWLWGLESVYYHPMSSHILFPFKMETQFPLLQLNLWLQPYWDSTSVNHQWKLNQKQQNLHFPFCLSHYFYFPCRYWNWIKSNLLHILGTHHIYLLMPIFSASPGHQQPSGQFYSHELTYIPAWVTNCIYYTLWDEIPFPNFNGSAVEVWELISNFIPHFTEHVITFPFWD